MLVPGIRSGPPAPPSSKKRQSKLNDSFREQTAARLSQLETKTDNGLREVGAAVDDAVKSGAAQVKQQMEQRFAELQSSEALYEADLHKHEVQLQAFRAS